jgi:hypothetical protein
LKVTDSGRENEYHTDSKTKEANWFGESLCGYYFPKQIIIGKIDESIYVTRRRGRRGKQLLNGLNKTRR